MIFGSLVVDRELYWYLSKHLFCSIYFADRWRCKCACRTLAMKNAQVGKFEHPSLPHLNSHGRQNYYFARTARALEERWDMVSLGYLMAEKLRVKLWKKFENRKIGKVWGAISRLRERNCKKPTTKSFLLYPRRVCSSPVLPVYAPFSQIVWAIWPLSEKFEIFRKFDGLPGPPVRDRAVKFCSFGDLPRFFER